MAEHGDHADEHEDRRGNRGEGGHEARPACGIWRGHGRWGRIVERLQRGRDGPLARRVIDDDGLRDRVCRASKLVDPRRDGRSQGLDRARPGGLAVEHRARELVL